MRKLILEEWISLDGYISDRNGKLDFFASMVRDIYAEPERSKFLETIDLILMGRQTYEQFVRVWPSRPSEPEVLADKMNRTDKVVFSNTLNDAPWGHWPSAEIVRGDIISYMRKLKGLSGNSIILWGSISLAQAFMKEDLIDEYHLHVCPTLTAGGRRLFPGDMNCTSLSLMGMSRYGTGTVLLKYQLA